VSPRDRRRAAGAWRHGAAVGVCDTEVVLGSGITLLRRLAVPFGGFGLVPGTPVEQAEWIQGKLIQGVLFSVAAREKAISSLLRRT